MDVDLGALNSVLADLESDLEDAVRPASQAAAQVFYNAVKQNVNAIGRKTGNLDASIYQAYSVSNSAKGKATYHVSWNHKKAPHGHLLEYGFIQRYATYVDKDGKWHTAVRPEKQGTPKPSRRASQAVKDAYYVPRPGGPVQWLPKAFVRRAVSVKPHAINAAEEELFKRIGTK